MALDGTPGSSHSLPPAKNGQLSKRSSGKVAKAKATAQQHQDAQEITDLVQQVEEVFQTTEEQTSDAIKGYAQMRGRKVVEAIASAPEVFHRTIEEGVAAIEIDHDSFRKRGESIRKSLFAGFSQFQDFGADAGLDAENDSDISPAA